MKHLPFVLVNATHRSASVLLNANESGVHEDPARGLEWLAPFDASPERCHFKQTRQDDGDAHHERRIIGCEGIVTITDGAFDLGSWQQISCGEFDGRGRERVLVKVIEE